MTFFKQKYRIESARLPTWNYSAIGWCFVTIRTRDGECFFGKIVDGEMRLSAMGEIAYRGWEDILKHFLNVKLDAFVFMPNHLHGIVVIEKDCRDVACNVSTVSTPDTSANPLMSMIAPKSKSLSVIMRSYKSAVSRSCHLSGYHFFAWQPCFYDHIIRSEKSLGEIREYIINNPMQWKLDRDNPAKLNM